MNRERNDRMRVLLTDEADEEARMADEAETEAYRQMKEKETRLDNAVTEAREKVQQTERLLKNQKVCHVATDCEADTSLAARQS